MRLYIFAIFSLIIMSLMLSACGDTASAEAAVPEKTEQAAKQSTSPAVSAKLPSLPTEYNQQLENVKNGLIKQKQDESIKITQAAKAGSDYLLVGYSRKNNVDAFVLYNMKNATFEDLPVIDANIKKAVSENYFIFEGDGNYTDSAFRLFPQIIKCFRTASGTDRDFTVIYENEYYELGKTVQAGSKVEEELSAVSVTFTGFEVLFKPISGKEDVFYADVTDIPPTTTSFNAATRQFTISVECAQMSDKIKSKTIIKTDDNQYISSYEIIPKDGKIYITANLRAAAKRYAIENKVGPLINGGGTGTYPYFSLDFAEEPSGMYDY